MRVVVYDPDLFRLMDSWPLEFAILVVAANGTTDHRCDLTVFDHSLSLEDLQAAHATRLFHLVESAILAGELEVVLGPNTQPLEKAQVRRIRRHDTGGTFEVHVPECGYTFIDVFDDPKLKPVEAPHFFTAATSPGLDRYVRRNAFCAWATSKGFHVPSDLHQPAKAMQLPSTDGMYDVFLAYNSKDKDTVAVIAEALRGKGISPWMDIEQIPPGRWLQDIIQNAISTARSAAICIGPTGLGKWQALELRSFVSQCVDRNIPVIPVVLPGLADIPESLIFLRQLNAVFFRSIDDQNALQRLIWGIKGQKHSFQIKY